MFLSIIDKHAPLRQRRVKNLSLPPWITNDLRNAMTNRDELKRAQTEKKKEIRRVTEQKKQEEMEIELQNISTEYKRQRNKVLELQR